MLPSVDSVFINAHIHVASESTVSTLVFRLKNCKLENQILFKLPKRLSNYVLYSLKRQKLTVLIYQSAWLSFAILFCYKLSIKLNRLHLILLLSLTPRILPASQQERTICLLELSQFEFCSYHLVYEIQRLGS